MRSRTAPTRRMGVESSATRAQLIEAAGKLLRKEGCAAVTARRLAEKLGLKRQIVHYYFSTIEDLLIAVIRRDSEEVRERLMQALESDEPLRVICELGSDVPLTIFEFAALALRRKAIQAEIRRYMVEIRKIETAAIARYLERRGIEPTLAPVVTAILMGSIAHTLAMERALGVSEGHAEMKAVIDRCLQAFAERGELSISGLNPG
jgi:TetR/AcrR family transcriptional regulator, regulator of autoinduction and epiphytic fitness